MKIKNIIGLLMLPLSLLGIAACSSSEDNPVVSDPVSVKSVSVENGSEVAKDVSSIEVTYSHPVSIANAAGITLNGQQISAKASGTKLTATVSLEAGTSYTFAIAANAVTRYGEPENFAPALTIQFSTPSDVVEPSNIDQAPVNPNATDAARQVYSYLLGQYGKKTLSGVMADVNNNNNFSDLVYASTGKHPALTAYDFIHLQYSPANWIDYSDTTPAETQWNAGGLVSYMWHWCVPSAEGETDPAKYGFYAPGCNSGSGETSFDIREALKDGTWQNKLILADIDKVAAYLKQLQEKGIAVIWRPLHEAAGNYEGNNSGAWFWWGRYGTAYTKQLWQLMYDRLTNTHQLNNLIWVWTVQVKDGFSQNALDAYPGNDYVDIIGTDIYEENTDSKLAAYKFSNAVSGSRKMVTLSECGNVPNPSSCFEAGDTWSWFMVWYGYESGKLSLSGGWSLMTAAYWKQLAADSHVVWREDMPKR